MFLLLLYLSLWSPSEALATTYYESPYAAPVRHVWAERYQLSDRAEITPLSKKAAPKKTVKTAKKTMKKAEDKDFWVSDKMTLEQKINRADAELEKMLKEEEEGFKSLMQTNRKLAKQLYPSQYADWKLEKMQRRNLVERIMNKEIE